MTIFIKTTLPTSTTVHVVVDTSLPAGLTRSTPERIAAAIAAARTDGTRHVYLLIWNQWERWCAALWTPALPGDPLALYAYLTERAEAGKANGTLNMTCVVVRYVDRMT